MNEKAKVLKRSIEQRIVGKGELVDKVITTVLAGGHLLIEDVPGVGKTSLARALADSLSLSFARIQCTPDTTPSDITGLSVYNPIERAFQVVPGPVLNNIVLADELNRTSPRTQSALLEVMEEGRVTIDGKSLPVPEPFVVIGTQNPSEMAGTYPLPESQLDRFMIRLSIGYPDTEASRDMVGRFLDGRLHSETVPVLAAGDIVEMKAEVKAVSIHENISAYAVGIAEATRNRPEISCGASPRALLSMLRYAQASAYMRGRSFCIPEDMEDAALLTLPHRLILSQGARLGRITGEEALRSILKQIKVPK
ncbi:MAG: MoxR family ATPase [Lachnospiraceae bacterium]|nr:MoxR family ATPase [Lachnospiraceae bacterium]